jgi:hypothetical protein
MIMEWRTRWRRRLFGWAFPAIIGENPLEITMTTWAIFSLTNLISGEAPSHALSVLPRGLEIGWCVAMSTAGITVGLALWKRREPLIASGLYMFATTLIAYSVAIMGASGWSRGGQAASFYLIIGIFCFLRGWWLKDDQAIEIREMVRSRRRGGK